MKEKLTIVATYEDNTTDKDKSDFQDYVDKIAKDWTASWDSVDVKVEVDGETYTAKQKGNRHEDDKEFVSELKGYPWIKATDGLPPHEGFVALAMKHEDGEFSMQMAYFRIEGDNRYFSATDNIPISQHTHSARVRMPLPGNLYWRYIGVPNF